MLKAAAAGGGGAVKFELRAKRKRRRFHGNAENVHRVPMCLCVDVSVAALLPVLPSQFSRLLLLLLLSGASRADRLPWQPVTKRARPPARLSLSCTIGPQLVFQAMPTIHSLCHTYLVESLLTGGGLDV